MNVLYLYADDEPNTEINTSNWRCVIPASAINATGLHTATLISVSEFAKQSKETVDAMNDSNVIVIERKPIGSILGLGFQEVANGKLVLIDLDDGYEVLPKTLPAYNFWNATGQLAESFRHLDGTPIEQLRWAAKILSGITSPSQIILDDWAEYTDNRYFVPNYIPYSLYDKHVKRDDGIIRLGWGGSLTHYESWANSGIVQGIQKLFGDPKYDCVELYLAGDARLNRLFPDHQARVKYKRWVPYEQWTKWLSLIDIGLVPLHGTYDMRRSWVKPIEYGAVGIPWIGSDYPPCQYFNSSAILVKRASGDDWYRAIAQMIDNLDGYYDKAAQESVFIESNYSAAHAGLKIISVYEQATNAISMKRRVRRANSDSSI